MRAFSTRVSEEPNMSGSMPYILYIFIISCIRRLSSESVIIEETEAFFRFSTLTSNLSFPRALRKISVRESVVSFKSSSEVSSLKISFTSASIRLNSTFSFFRSTREMKGESILCFRITAFKPASLNILMYWLCCTSSVT